MSTVLDKLPGVAAVKKVRVSWPMVLIGLAVAILLISLLRTITDADDVASSGTLRAGIRAAMPIALAGLAGLWSERAGVVNIGLEGMMIMGTLGAGYAGYQWGMWAGLFFAALFGALAGLLHAVATIGFGVDHIVSGVAINVIAAGAARYIAGLVFTGKEGGGPTQSPKVDSIPTFDVPLLADWSSSLEKKHWFFVSDLGAVVASVTNRLSLLTLLGVVLFVLTWWILWRTTFGLRVRSVGESPAAAESLGVAVYRYKYVAVVISGALAGLAGAYLVDDASIYREGQTGGRGYIGLAAMIFGNWRPGGLAAGAGLFGYTDAVRLRSGETSVHALLLLMFVLLVAFALWMLRKGNRTQAVVTAGIGLALLVLFLVTDTIANDFTSMAPQLVTLLVLSLAAQRLRMPAADGQIYRKGSAG